MKSSASSELRPAPEFTLQDQEVAQPLEAMALALAALALLLRSSSVVAGSPERQSVLLRRTQRCAGLQQKNGS